MKGQSPIIAPSVPSDVVRQFPNAIIRLIPQNAVSSPGFANKQPIIGHLFNVVSDAISWIHICPVLAVLFQQLL